MPKLLTVSAFLLFLMVLSPASGGQAWGADGIPETDGPQYDGPKTEAPALPTEFGFTFGLPYGQADEYPRDEKEFERMMVLLKGAGFNTIYCPYTPWRHELFKKHGMKMMVDVLAWKPPVETDIRRNDEQRAKVKAICEACKDSDAIWGYNLWNERLDWCGDFKKLDLWLRMLRTWDPSHPVWVGTYQHLYCEHYPTFPGVIAWYDYHWQRGFAYNFQWLGFYRPIAEKRKSVMGKWLAINDYNRSLYTLNTSIANGVKVVIWFIGGPYAAREPDVSKRWNEDTDLVRVGRRMQPLYKMIGQLGLPYGVYSTLTHRTADNKDLPKPVLPARAVAFPKDFWLSFPQGEVLAGMFKLPDGSDVAYICNHNAWAWQGVVMEIAHDKNKPRRVERFDREKADWVAVGETNQVNFAIPPGDAEVYRFAPAAAGAKPAETPAEPKVAADYRPQQHFERVAKLLAERKELAAGQQPHAVYSTPTLRTIDNQPKEEGIPEGFGPFPAEFWLAVKQGELACGLLKLADGGDAVVLANHNRKAWQGGLVIPKQDKSAPTIIWEFDDEAQRWNELGAWEDLNFPIPPGGATLLKFKR